MKLFIRKKWTESPWITFLHFDTMCELGRFITSLEKNRAQFKNEMTDEWTEVFSGCEALNRRK